MRGGRDDGNNFSAAEEHEGGIADDADKTCGGSRLGGVPAAWPLERRFTLTGISAAQRRQLLVPLCSGWIADDDAGWVLSVPISH